VNQLDTDTDTRALGWHRFRMIARAVGTSIGVLCGLWLLTIALAGADQGSLIAFYLTMFVLMSVPATIITRMYAHFLGEGNFDRDCSYNAVPEAVLCGFGIFLFTAYTAMWLVLAFLAVIGVLTW
jgi:hypothetical protein